jgi:hypothetical protein
VSRDYARANCDCVSCLGLTSGKSELCLPFEVGLGRVVTVWNRLPQTGRDCGRSRASRDCVSLLRLASGESWARASRGLRRVMGSGESLASGES